MSAMSPAIPKSWPSLYHRRRAAPSDDDGQAGGPLSPADQEFGGMGEGGFVDPSREHPGELSAALLAIDSLYPRDRPPSRFFFLDDDVRACLGGYLREVGDGQDLVAVAECPQLRAHRRCCLAAYTGVDLVEDLRIICLLALLGEPSRRNSTGEISA